MSIDNNNTIISKSCNYNCGTRIYWDNSESAYLEVFTKKRHACPNRSKSVTQTTITNNTTATTAARPNYYNKFAKQPKPKTYNSFELLQGPIAEIQMKYEILSDIVTEANGKVHGSQRDRDPKTGLIDLMVYYEVPQGKREEVKQRLKNYVLTVNSS